ncbi:B3GL1 acetylgalactosaminyltransferase, partial [Alcedo cyanopectus]|nr:B3GL1 acetylgalactosaminyltransferase [Ceyx cyanopectus]
QCPVSVGVMHMRTLRWIFLFLLLFSVLTMWYVLLSPGTVSQGSNMMYFYDYEPVHKQRYLFTLREHPQCHHIHPFLVILVASHPRDIKSRQAIRVTWAAQDFWWGQRILTLFLLGQEVGGGGDARALSVEDESVLYGDIVQQGFADTYDNLTLKTIMAFRWLSEFCPTARFLMKTDADVFINTGNLVKLLLKLNSSEDVFTGYPLIDNFAYRGFYKKRYISYQEYPFRFFPPYCSGMGYIVDTKLALRIYQMMEHIRPIKFEDVYVGICLNILQVNISVPEDQEQFFLNKIPFDICKYRHLIAVHGVTASEIIGFWQDLSSNTSISC